MFNLEKSNNTEMKNYTEKERVEYCEHTEQIANAYTTVDKCGVKIALELYPIYTKKLYSIDNYRNIYDYAKDKFGIAKGTCCGFLHVAEQFGEIDENGEIKSLKQEYKDYGISKLAILTTIDPQYHSELNPSMTVKALKQFKREKESPFLNSETETKDSEKTLSQNPPKEFPEYFYDTYEEFQQHENDIKKGLEDFKQKNPECQFSLKLSVVQAK